MIEVWKDIPGYCGYYQVSNLSRIKSKSRLSNNSFSSFTTKEIILSQCVSKTGYYSVSLYINKKEKRTCKVHRLIAKAFIPNPENKPEVNHKDGDTLNNNIDNLEWCTHVENMQHAFRTGLIPNKNRKKVLLLSIDKNPLLWFDSIKEAMLALELKLSCSSNISSCLSGKRKNAYGYKWAYY